LKYPLMLCFFLNALSFLPMLFFLSFINPISKKEKNIRKISIFKEIVIFFQFLKNEKKIIYVLILLANFTFFATSIIILLPMLVDKFLHRSAKDFAYLSSGIGLGAILGALLVFLLKEPKRKVYYLYLAHIFWTLGILSFILGNNFKVFYFGALLVGLSFTNFYPIVNAYLQESTPLEYRGKIMSLFSMAFLSMAPLGQSFTGFLAEFMSYKVLLIFMIGFLILFDSILLQKILSKA
ncbi:MAG: MFS transporter, partial [bacterium]